MAMAKRKKMDIMAFNRHTFQIEGEKQEKEFVVEKHLNESPTTESSILLILNNGFQVTSNNYSMNKTKWNVNGGTGIEYALQHSSGKIEYTYLNDGTYRESIKKLIEDNNKN